MIKSALRQALAGAFMLLLACSPAIAADTTITHMTPAATLNGSEVVPGVQSSANVKISISQIKTFSWTGLANIATSGSGADLSSNSVTLGKLATQSNNTLLGNNSGSAAAPLALTAAQAKAILGITPSDITGIAAIASSGSASDLITGTIPTARLPIFTSTTNGAVTASGGGTTNFLRADGTWALPPGGGGSGTVTSVSVVTANSLSGTVATATSTPAITLDIAAFTSSTKGAVPASGGGTTNFLRADGTWAAPSGTGGGSGVVTSQSGTTYTFVLGDANTWVRSTATSATIFTIPLNSSVAFPVGTEIDLVQAGTGSLAIAGASGVTVNARGGASTLAGQYGVAFIKKVLTDTWVLGGDIL